MRKEHALHLNGTKGRRAPWLVLCALLMTLLVGFSASTCTVADSVIESCSDSDDCGRLPGTLCIDYMCACPGYDLSFCNGACRLATECEIGAGGAGGAGGSGGSGSACTTAADCPQPGHSRCGSATCENGVCGMELNPFGPLASQVLGDCKEILCDGFGNLVEVKEASDVYNDGAQCIDDRCEGGEPVNMLFGPGYACSENGGQYCFEGKCGECVAFMGVPCGGGLACDGVLCVQMHCVNNTWDKGDGETGHNCGGPCRPCPTGSGCYSGADCFDGVCVSGSCVPPTCSDGVRNDSETGIDCGGPPSCPRCPDGQHCKVPSDCQSDVCWTGICQPPKCNDGIKNGDETDWDCGGSCGPCP
jgi:hypothetical protein